jgi:hypothetical protein
MPNKRLQYTEPFKRDIVEQVLIGGKTPPEVSKDTESRQLKSDYEPIIAPCQNLTRAPRPRAPPRGLRRRA